MPTSNESTNQNQSRLFEPRLAANEVLRRVICERPPFVRWRPEEPSVSRDLDDDFQLAVSAYALSIYLHILKERFGAATAEKTHTSILELSSFNKTIESRLPIFLEAIRSANASGDRLFGDHINNAEARTYWSLAAFISTAAAWPLSPYATVAEEPLLRTLVECLAFAKTSAHDTFGTEIVESEESFEPHRWSGQPGPFERQLQRQEGNPLFPTEHRKISREQIQAARMADLRKVFVFTGECRPFFQAMISIRDQTTVKELSDYWRKAVDLTVPCARLGPYFSPEMKKLEATIDSLERELTKTIAEPNFREGLRDYKALAEVQREVPLAISETIKELGLDSKELWIRSVLSEGEKAIWAFGALATLTKLDYWDTARNIVNAAIHEGLPADVGNRKLKVFREGMESQTQKTGSGFWNATKNIFREDA